MSYATVAKENREPPSQQPRPDTALLNTEPSETSLPDGDSTKVNVAPADFKEHPKVCSCSHASEHQMCRRLSSPCSMLHALLFMSPL